MRQRLRPPLSRQEILNAWSADQTFKKENAERPTSNAQRRTRKGRASFGILFSRPDTGHENPDQLVDFTQACRKARDRSQFFQANGQAKPARSFTQFFQADS